MQDCVFCKIVACEIPSQKRYEDDEVVAIDDIHPTAPVHVLVVPKKHVVNTIEAGELAGKLMRVAEKLASELQIADGYQIIMNGGRYREVAHLHYHLKGGVK